MISKMEKPMVFLFIMGCTSLLFFASLIIVDVVLDIVNFTLWAAG